MENKRVQTPAYTAGIGEPVPLQGWRILLAVMVGAVAVTAFWVWIAWMIFFERH
jgi:hypothetical protein